MKSQEAVASNPSAGGARPRALGVPFGVLPTGPGNAITDVAGVRVGSVTLEDVARGMHTGVTAILPHPGNLFAEKLPAGVFVGNGFGKMTGIAQIRELGEIETPVVLTNTLSVGAALEGLAEWTLTRAGNESVRSVNPVVGETNDGRVNDIRSRFVRSEHVLSALEAAAASSDFAPVAEGCVGAGTGTVAFGFKAGIGTASRKLPTSLGGHVVGVLVQANFGGFLSIAGAPVWRALGGWPCEREILAALAGDAGKGSASGLPGECADGSIMMIVATDAPLDARNLSRLAERAFLGMARTGGVASNGSGDFALAFSTARSRRIPHDAAAQAPLVSNDDMTPLFIAAIEATEEAIINALFAARDRVAFDGTLVRALPRERVLKLLDAHGARSIR